MNIDRRLTEKAINLKCDDSTLKEIVKRVIDNNTNGFFPVSHLKTPICATLSEEDQFVDYEKHYYEPTLTYGDFMRINKILCELIVSGYLGINFFDRHYSGNDVELFKI